MLVTLTALGSGPASFLGARFAAATRLAIMPALGLCLGTCVFTTLIWFTAARHTYWLLPLLAAASVATAVRRARGREHERGPEREHEGGPEREHGSKRGRASSAATARPWLRDAISLAVVCIVVAAPLSYTLHERNSVGPTGYFILDAVGYVGETDGMTQESMREAYRKAPLSANLTRRFWKEYVPSYENVDAAPLSASLNEVLGLGSTATQGLFLIVFLITGALGVFAAVRYFAPKPSWAAPLAGVLFAGPFFLQLMADGSQAAICGIAVIPPFAIVGAEALREHRLANLVLLALLGSGLIALYPLLAPSAAVASALALLVVGVQAWRGGRLNARVLRWAAGRVALVTVLACLFNLVSFLRDVHYWEMTASGESFMHKPEYELPVSVLPGWLLQTRQFFYLSSLSHASAHQLLIGVALPAILILVILIGLWRRPATLILVPPILVCSALAEYTSAKYNCSYCVDRNMLPVAPLSIALLGLGLAALATMPSRWLRWPALLVAVAALIAVGSQTRSERELFANNAYFLDGGTKALVSDLPAHAGPLEIEAYGQDPHRSAGELPFTYFMASERNHEEVSVANEYTDYDALSYLGGPRPGNPQLKPDYRYVLTRLGGVRTSRRVLARAGPLALEERTEPLDVTVVSGIAMPAIRLDETGLAPVVGPLRVLVVGPGSAPVWVRLELQTLAPAQVPTQPGVRATTTENTVTACVLATGAAPIRHATLVMEGQLLPGILPNEPFAVPEPPRGIELVGMRAAGSCSPK